MMNVELTNELSKVIVMISCLDDYQQNILDMSVKKSMWNVKYVINQNFSNSIGLNKHTYSRYDQKRNIS